MVQNEEEANAESWEKYVSSSGKIIPEKKHNFHECSCKNKNCKDLTKEERDSAHRSFWAMGNLDDQNAYLLTLIKSKEKKVRKRCYRINEVDMCKEVFKTVFSISNGRLSRLLQRHDQNPNELPKDRRGPKEDQGISEEVVAKMIEIINRLPRYTSHYNREKETDNTVFLEPDCQWKNVYNLLEEELPLATKLPSPAWFYQKVGFPM